MITTLVGAFCAFACAFPLHISQCTFDHCDVFNGTQQVGVYVDDSQPNQCAVAASYRALGWSVVFTGRFARPGYTGPYCAQATLNLLEWYPWINGREAWGPPPRARGYILPWHFSFAGPPPTPSQRELELDQAQVNHPEVILWYYAN